MNEEPRVAVEVEEVKAFVNSLPVRKREYLRCLAQKKMMELADELRRESDRIDVEGLDDLDDLPPLIHVHNHRK
jgi:hypothetical protein